MNTVLKEMRIWYIGIANTKRFLFFAQIYYLHMNIIQVFNSTSSLYVISDMKTHATPTLWHFWIVSLILIIKRSIFDVYLSKCYLSQHVRSQYWCYLDLHLNNVKVVLRWVSVQKTKQSCIPIPNTII